MVNIALRDELQRLVRKRVENGEFPNEEAVVEEALMCFLNQEPSEKRRPSPPPIESLDDRPPGSFIDDLMVSVPLELPRESHEIAYSSLEEVTRQPTLFPGE